MKHSKFIFIAVIASLFFFSCARKSGNWNVISPDSSLKITLLLDHSSLFYQAECISGGKWDTVIKRSPLGIERSDMDFTTGLAFTSISDVKTIDESYKMLIGKQLQCRNHANEITLTISNSKGSEMQVIARAYNDGVAFRYAFAEKSDTAVTIKNELSAFRIPTSGKAWMLSLIHI